MKNKNLILIIVVVFLSFNSCKETENDLKDEDAVSVHLSDDCELITEKILYDVCIVNDLLIDRTKENPDWFWENLPEPYGDDFIKKLVEEVLSGERQAYYYDQTGDYENFEAIPIKKQKEYLKSQMLMDVEYLDETGDEPEVKIANIQFGTEHVEKLRFLEEWYIDDDVFHKKVIAVAPFFTVIYPGLNDEFSTIFFWILLDEDKMLM